MILIVFKDRDCDHSMLKNYVLNIFMTAILVALLT